MEVIRDHTAEDGHDTGSRLDAFDNMGLEFGQQGLGERILLRKGFAIAYYRIFKIPTLVGLGTRAVDVLKHFGDRVRERILRKGYASVELFAHENRIPKSTLSEILNGKNDPKLTTVAKICSGLEMTLSELFHDASLDQWVQESAPDYVSRKPSPARKTRKKKPAPNN